MERPRTRRPESLMAEPGIHISKINSKKRTHEQIKPAKVLFKEFDSGPPWKKQRHRQDTLFKEVDSTVPWKKRGLPRSEETAKLDRLVSNIGTVSVQGGATSSNPVSSPRVTFKGVVDAATNPAHFDPRGGLSFARQVFDAVKRSGSPSRVENVSGRPILDSGGHSLLGQESGRFGASKGLHHSNHDAKGPKITGHTAIQQPPMNPSPSLHPLKAQYRQPKAHQRQSSPSIYFHHWVPPNSQGRPRADNPQTPSGKSEHDAKRPKITGHTAIQQPPMNPSPSLHPLKAQYRQPKAHQRQSSPSIYFHHWVPPNSQSGPRTDKKSWQSQYDREFEDLRSHTLSPFSSTNTVPDDLLLKPVQIEQDSRPRFSVSKVAQSKLFVTDTISRDVSRGDSENCNRLCALKQRPSHLGMRKMQVAEKQKRDSGIFPSIRVEEVFRTN